MLFVCVCERERKTPEIAPARNTHRETLRTATATAAVQRIGNSNVSAYKRQGEQVTQWTIQAREREFREVSMPRRVHHFVLIYTWLSENLHHWGYTDFIVNYDWFLSLGIKRGFYSTLTMLLDARCRLGLLLYARLSARK